MPYKPLHQRSSAWHFVRTICGGGLFVGQTRVSWYIASNTNGFCHSFPKLRFRTLRLPKVPYVWFYNYLYPRNKALALWAFSKI